MSGGHFCYAQNRIVEIADEIEHLIRVNDYSWLDAQGERMGHGYSPETIERFRDGVNLLRRAAIYAQRIDWLVSGDDGEESFHVRLASELDRVTDSEPAQRASIEPEK
jgi:hypothetical protein